MSRQLRLFVVREDVLELEQAWRRELEFIFLPERVADVAASAFSSIETVDRALPWMSLYLLQPSDLRDVWLRDLGAGQTPRVDDLRSPVVQLSVPLAPQPALRPGRLFYSRSYFDEQGSKALKSESFVRWANQLFVIARRTLRRVADGGGRVGPMAARMVDEGRAELRDV